MKRMQKYRAVMDELLSSWDEKTILELAYETQLDARAVRNVCKKLAKIGAINERLQDERLCYSPNVKLWDEYKKGGKLILDVWRLGLFVAVANDRGLMFVPVSGDGYQMQGSLFSLKVVQDA